MSNFIREPLQLVRVINALEQSIANDGLRLTTSHDLEELVAARFATRGDQISPMFDPQIANLDHDTVLWTKLENDNGDIVALSAYRLDLVATNLADWASGWMIGHYIRRNELVVPSHISAPEHSLAHSLNGKVVYYGELWHREDYRRHRLLDRFPRLGLFLCFLKWHPDAIWGLAATPLSRRGGVVKIGFPRLERSFLRWHVPPEGADKSEWISIATPDDLHFMVAEEYERLGLDETPDKNDD